MVKRSSAIQMSEHFVYIENQFFITRSVSSQSLHTSMVLMHLRSTVVSDVKIENQIGDALVSRIIRAHHERTPWRACIVIPLLPGFTFPIDHSDASAVRIILECQNRTIGRGPNSIFARLRKEGIDVCPIAYRAALDPLFHPILYSRTTTSPSSACANGVSCGVVLLRRNRSARQLCI